MLRWVALTLAVACSMVLFRIGVIAPRRIPLNYNEGWNAYHTAGVLAGQPLYPSPAGLVLTNYPPLSFYFVAAAGRSPSATRARRSSGRSGAMPR